MQIKDIFNSILLVIILFPYTSIAMEQFPLQSNTGDATFFPVSELSHTASGFTLVGGMIADVSKWKASFYTSNEQGGRCTSTLIGPNALLTAAHCVGNGRTVTIRYVLENKRFSGTCTHAPGYPEDKSADYALCLMKVTTDTASIPSSPIPVPYHERLSFDSVNLGQNVLLAGYGCTNSNITGGNDGKFRIGFAPVNTLPNDTDSNYFTTQSNTFICPGDSGGAAYTGEIQGRRSIVGLNSQVSCKTSNCSEIGNTSFISATFTQLPIKFFCAWSKQYNQRIGGLSQEICT